MNQLTVSLWGDEAWAATLINRDPLAIIRLVSSDTSPPLYYLLLHFWTRIFGFGEIALRSFSLFLWFLTAVFTALIARHFWKNKTVTLFAFIATLLNPFLFQYAFEARMYAILVFMSTAATYFFLTQKWFPYIIFAAASLYSHHFSLFVIFWHFLWTIFRRQSIKPFIFIFLLYLPWLPVMYFQTKMVTTNGFWLSRPEPRHLLEVVLKFITGSTSHSLQPLNIFLASSLLLLRRWSKDTPTLFLLGWLLIPLFLVYGLSQAVQPIFYDRYLINLIPAFILILISRVRLPYLYSLTAFFLISISILDLWFFLHPTKRPFRELAAYIKQNQQLGETLINWSGPSHHLFESKYYNVYAPIYTPNGSLPFYTGTALMTPNDQIQTLPDSPLIGLISSQNTDQISLPDYAKIDEYHLADLNYSRWLKLKNDQNF